MKSKTFLVADGESTGLGRYAYLFDFAYAIVTRKKTLIERTFLVKEILTNPRIMLGAFFNPDWRSMMGSKIFNHYIPQIAKQDYRIYPWREIVETMREDMRTYSVDVFSAYNLNFDMGAIANTQKYIYEGGKVLEYKPDLLCLWKFACDTLCNSPMYHDTARKMGVDTGWITEAGNVRTNAEKVYAYLSGDLNFIESHTAQKDVQIETEILQRLLAKKKKIPYNDLEYMPWRKAQIIHG